MIANGMKGIMIHQMGILKGSYEGVVLCFYVLSQEYCCKILILTQQF